MKKAALVVMVASLVACNGFVGAKIGLQMGRAALGVAQIGMDEAARHKQAECLQKGKLGSPEYVACYAEMAKTEGLFEVSKRVATAAFDVAEASIEAAELKGDGGKIDWTSLLRKGACFVAETLEYIPDKYRKKVQMYLDFMRAYGCQK